MISRYIKKRATDSGYIDINLDIGGRSTEIAMKILGKEGINIKKSETGGFFTCTLELNLNNGETTIQPGWNPKANPDMEMDPPSKEDIDRTIESLNPIPQTALKILRIVQQDNYSFENISKELQKDQVLAARTIQMCNSAIFKGRVKIETLKDALMILGETTLINSLVTAAINNYFSQSEKGGYSMCKGSMFFHSIGCAVTAEIIANRTGKANPQIAYTAGLLHDIGKVVLDQHITIRYPMFFRELYHKKADYLTVEKNIIGINHCEAGVMLAEKWNFSDLMIDVIQYHHAPEKSSPVNRDLVNMLYIADLLISRFNTNPETDKIESEDFTKILTSLDLSISDLPEIIDAIPLHIFDLNI
ncbi:MAG: HDOD domain-containing protein [Desulfamplus sp.]|nr:HDOD domain-containing protein [Desulfamplus sp.]